MMTVSLDSPSCEVTLFDPVFGGFNGHLADSKKLEAFAANQCSDLDEFVDNLDELLLLISPGRLRGCPFFMRLQLVLQRDFSDQTQTDLRRCVPYFHSVNEEATRFESLSNLEDSDRLLKLEDKGAIAYRGGGGLFSTTTRTQTTTSNPFRVVTWV
jgi:hypothetical protein